MGQCSLVGGQRVPPSAISRPRRCCRSLALELGGFLPSATALIAALIVLQLAGAEDRSPISRRGRRSAPVLPRAPLFMSLLAICNTMFAVFDVEDDLRRDPRNGGGDDCCDGFSSDACLFPDWRESAARLPLPGCSGLQDRSAPVGVFGRGVFCLSMSCSAPRRPRSTEAPLLRSRHQDDVVCRRLEGNPPSIDRAAGSCSGRDLGLGGCRTASHPVLQSTP